ncbi:ATP-binding protein [Streptomyces sp. NPDC091281]|uniref:ATP-binding protein n=1 Tax=Streptomyces sp. NPDC091281 TaxID=3365985 RepID=UPI0037FABA83
MRGDELAPVDPGFTPVPAVTTAAAARDRARAVVDAAWTDPARPPGERDLIDLLLVVSELVTNAIRHGGGLAGFEASATADGVLLAVHDHSDTVPAGASGTAAFPVGHLGSGYGWPLIARLARDITVHPRRAGGKTITVFVPVGPEETAENAENAENGDTVTTPRTVETTRTAATADAAGTAEAGRTGPTRCAEGHAECTVHAGAAGR